MEDRPQQQRIAPFLLSVCGQDSCIHCLTYALKVRPGQPERQAHHKVRKNAEGMPGLGQPDLG
jgi:hypothetical protein